MANNKTAKDATGATVTYATDDISGVDYPIVKLAFGADNTGTWASAADPLPVDPGLVVLDDSDAIEVRGNTTVLRPTVTTTATPDYSSGDTMGGEITISNAVRTTSGAAVLQWVALWCDDALTPVLDLMFFDADLTGGTYTDNATFAPSSADKAAFLGSVHIAATDWVTLAGDTWANKLVGLPLKANGSQDLRLIVVAGETINLSGTAVLTVALGLLRD